MMLSQAATVLNAKVRGVDVLFTAISKDTRSIANGDLYVAIKGDHFDGHLFMKQAEMSGAAAALVSDWQKTELSQLCVADTRLALGKLAAYWVQKWHQPVQQKLIGITGSNGKTTVKEMCRNIFAQAAGDESVLSTQGNFNNNIGLPLTLLGLRKNHRYAVIEMGANHVGEIDYLTEIARPDIAVITNANPAHLLGFGSIENIADAKAEIFNGLSAQGVAIINDDDAFSEKWIEQATGKTQVLFSMENNKVDVFARQKRAGVYEVKTPQGTAEFQLLIPGRHNVMNALAATAAASVAGIDLDVIVESLNTFRNIRGRLTVTEMNNGSKVIDDSYNANPVSVCAAIDVLAEQSGKKILILGDMAELGNNALKLHAEAGIYAKRAGIDVLYTIGEQSLYTAQAFGENAEHFATKKMLLKKVLSDLSGKEVILIKGSRSAAMEEVLAGILMHKNNQRIN